jgi:DNA primase
MLDPIARQQIIDRLPTFEYIGRFVGLKKHGQIYQGLCPFHNDSQPSFVVYEEDSRGWYCFGSCQEGGDLFNFVMKYKKVGFSQAAKILAEEAGVQLLQDSGAAERKRLIQTLGKAAEIYHQGLLQGQSALAKTCREYLKRRSISPEMIKLYQLGLAPESGVFGRIMLQEGYDPDDLLKVNLRLANGKDFFYRRLLFPIRDHLGQVRGFGARALDENVAKGKYINSAQSSIFDKSRLIYGLHLAGRCLRQRPALLVEGYTDVITAYQSGHCQTVGLMGLSLTQMQIKLLCRYTGTAIFVYDGDQAGLKALARQAAIGDGGLIKLKAIILPAGEDPDSLIRKDPNEWEKRIQAAQPLLEIYLEQAVITLNLNGADSRSGFLKSISPALAGLDPVRFDYYVEFLAHQLGVQARSIREFLKEMNLNLPAHQAKHATRTLDLEDIVLGAFIVNPQLANLATERDFSKEINRLIFAAVRSDQLDASLESYFDYLLELWADLAANTADAQQEIEGILFRMRRTNRVRETKARAEAGI